MNATVEATKIRISEIFGPTIQGEGPTIGRPTVFVRTGGCDSRCVWCDSAFAVDPKYRDSWRSLTAEEILTEVERLAPGVPLTISLSGGNPALQPLEPLIDLGHGRGYSFFAETQGTVARPWFAKLENLILSPKPPSSGEEVDWKQFAACLAMAGTRPRAALKIVIFDDEDFQWARSAAARHPGLPLYLQPGNPNYSVGATVSPEEIASRLRWLVRKTLSERWYEATVLPQMHVLLWGNQRGV